MVDLEANIQFVKRIRISPQKWRLIVRCFAIDCTAWQTAQLAHLNYNTAKRYIRYLRLVVAAQALKERRAKQIANGIEIDESYFGPRRLRGKPGRSRGGKVIVLGLLRVRGAIHCEIIPGASRKEVLPIIRATVKSGALPSDGSPSLMVYLEVSFRSTCLKPSGGLTTTIVCSKQLKRLCDAQGRAQSCAVI